MTVRYYMMGCGRSKAATECVTPDDSHDRQHHQYQQENGGHNSHSRKTGVTSLDGSVTSSDYSGGQPGLGGNKRSISNGDSRLNGDASKDRDRAFTLRNPPLQAATPAMGKCSDSQTEFFRLLDERIEQGADYEPSVRMSVVSMT